MTTNHTPVEAAVWRGEERRLQGPPLIASAPPTVAIERLVYQLLRWPLMPLRLLSGYVSRSRRRNGTAV